MQPSPLSFLERYALSSSSERVSILKSPSTLATLKHEAREVDHWYLHQRQLEFIERYFPTQNKESTPAALPRTANGITLEKNPPNPQQLPKDALKMLEEDTEYKTIMKRILDSNEKYRSLSEREILRRHTLLKWSLLSPSDQADFLRTLTSDLSLSFLHTKPYVRETHREDHTSLQEDQVLTGSATDETSVTPSVLSSDVLDLPAVCKDRFLNRGGLNAFEPTATAHEWLSHQDAFEQFEWRLWIQSLKRADVSGLVRAYGYALKEKDAYFSFGSSTVDSLLSLNQLLELGSSVSELRKKSGPFLAALFRKQVCALYPYPLAQMTLSERKIFYTAMWKFAKEDLGNGADDDENPFCEIKARMYFACLRFDVEELETYNFDHFFKLINIPMTTQAKIRYKRSQHNMTRHDATQHNTT